MINLKNNRKLLTIFSALVVMSSIILGGIFFQTSSVFAEPPAPGWCSPDDLNDYTNSCIDDVWKNLPADKAGLSSQDDLKNIAKKCMGGDAPGRRNPSEGGCINAAAYCVQHVVDPKQCGAGEFGPDILADTALNCNDGAGEGGKICDRVAELNEDAYRKAYEDAAKKAEETCTASTDNNTSDKNACKKVVCNSFNDNSCTNAACPVSKDAYYGQVSDPNKLKEYNDCLTKTLKESAKDSAECEKRGGIWSEEFKDPVANSSSNVSKGCKNQMSDLVNEPACTAAGGKWQQTGGADTSKTQDDDYGCKDPNAPVDGENGGKDDPADGANGNVSGGDKKCGAARTNLISCTGEGEQALGDVLRIFIFALTMIIGVAATGGLAWSAVLYAKAEDNQSNVSQAKEMIRNIVIGILVYGFMVAIVNWLIPGGIIQ